MDSERRTMMAGKPSTRYNSGRVYRDEWNGELDTAICPSINLLRLIPVKYRVYTIETETLLLFVGLSTPDQRSTHQHKLIITRSCMHVF